MFYLTNLGHNWRNFFTIISYLIRLSFVSTTQMFILFCPRQDF